MELLETQKSRFLVFPVLESVEQIKEKQKSLETSTFFNFYSIEKDKQNQKTLKTFWYLLSMVRNLFSNNSNKIQTFIGFSTKT